MEKLVPIKKDELIEVDGQLYVPTARVDSLVDMSKPSGAVYFVWSKLARAYPRDIPFGDKPMYDEYDLDEEIRQVYGPFYEFQEARQFKDRTRFTTGDDFRGTFGIVTKLIPKLPSHGIFLCYEYRLNRFVVYSTNNRSGFERMTPEIRRLSDKYASGKGTSTPERINAFEARLEEILKSIAKIRKEKGRITALIEGGPWGNCLVEVNNVHDQFISVESFNSESYPFLSGHLADVGIDPSECVANWTKQFVSQKWIDVTRYGSIDTIIKDNEFV